MALGSSSLVIVSEQPDLVPYTAASQARHPQARVDGVGEGQGLEEPALSLDDQPDYFSMSRTPAWIKYSFTTVSKYE